MFILKGRPVNLACPIGLLDLSDSYCEKQLKRICERTLWQSVSVENVMTLVAVADKYKAEVCNNVHVCMCMSVHEDVSVYVCSGACRHVCV